MSRPGLRRSGRFLGRILPLLRPHWRRTAVAGASTLGFIAAGLVAPWPIQMVIDGVLLGRRDQGMLAWLDPLLPRGAMPLLAVCAGSVVAIAVMQGVFYHAQRLQAAAVGHRVIADLRMAVFAKLQRLSLRFHGRQRTGDLLVRMTGDVGMLREMLVPAVLDSASRVLVLAGMLGLMLWMDPWLAAIAIGMLPLLALLAVRFGSRIRSVTRKQRKKEGKIASVAGEALASVAAVQAFSRERDVVERFSRQNLRSLRAGLKSLRLAESLNRIVEVLLAAGTALVLWIGARRVVVAGSMSPGELIVFLAYLKGMYKPIQRLVRTTAKVGKAVACGERVLEVLDSREEVTERPGAVEAPRFRGEIVFDRVTFAYDDGEPVLRDVSFRIRAGETIGLVGPSGSGKSTLLSLLLRLHEQQSGRILVDGQDIRAFTLESYRRRIGVLLQDPCLFGVSAAENIAHGRPGATAEQIVAAARNAGAHEFLSARPDGYDTILGEKGRALSRGQQQRVALARTLVRGAPILVFDEPTAGLDPRVERGVLRALAAATRNRTCLWIAHDLRQVLGCSRVLVLVAGRVAEEGTPAALLRGAGQFRALFLGSTS